MSGATIIRADARSLPLPNASVDLIVTSPPYFALRSYSDGGEHYAGQVGSEATPAEFIEALIECTREMVRVLKPTGSIWLNLGDKYSSGGRTTYDRTDVNGARGGAVRPRDGFPPKTLLLLPERYRIACVDQLGLIARAVVIWSKPNGLPESVTDRVRRSHEDWVHLTKEPRYFAAVDEIRESTHRHGLTWEERKATGARTHAPDNGHMSGGPGMAANPLGKLPGSVWEIATQPLIVPAELGIDHFAAFPMEWPRRIILGWSPSGICVECGDGRRPVTVPTGETGRHPGGGGTYRALRGVGEKDTNLADAALRVRAITGYACACTPYIDHPGVPVQRSDDRTTGLPPRTTRGQLGAAPLSGGWREYLTEHWTPAPTRPAVVLDPFGGTGTTALLAKALGRHGISVDMSADYCRLAEWRTTDPGELAKAMQVEKPPAVLDGQLSLLDLAMEGAQ